MSQRTKLGEELMMLRAKRRELWDNAIVPSMDWSVGKHKEFLENEDRIQEIKHLLKNLR